MTDRWEIIGDMMEEYIDWMNYENDMIENNPWAE